MIIAFLRLQIADAVGFVADEPAGALFQVPRVAKARGLPEPRGGYRAGGNWG